MRRLVALLALVALVAGCGGDDDAGGTVTVVAAASLTDGFEAIAAEFEGAFPDATVELSFGPSSGIVTQITEGAPADVVATAATAPMDDLAADGALDGEPSAFATNALELAVPPGNPGDVDGLADLADEDLVVGLCHADVPCGGFARGVLADAGIEASVDTEEEDVRALLTKVEAGEVDVGVVYRSDVEAAGDGVEGIAIPDDQNVVATYPIAAVDGAANLAGAQRFIAFVLSERGQAALAEAGFGPPG